MKYLLVIYGDTAAWDDLEANGWDALDRAHRSLIEELTASGELIMTNELSTKDARVVRRDAGEIVVTEGPFIEGKEIVGGFYLVEATDMDRAVEIAGRLEETTFSVVEVRQLVH